MTSNWGSSFQDQSPGLSLALCTSWQTSKSTLLKHSQTYKRYLIHLEITFLRNQCFQVYGSIFQIKLGSALAVVIHSEDDKREVLMTKGDHFDGRPDFKRFDVMFGGDRRNCKIIFFLQTKINIFPSALAFCDFDKLQDVRRKMMKKHTFPNAGSGNWAKLDQVWLKST